MASKLYEAAGWSALGMLAVGTIIGNSPPLETRGWGPQVFPPPAPAPIPVADPGERPCGGDSPHYITTENCNPSMMIVDPKGKTAYLPHCAAGWRCLPLGAPTACECEAQP
jgi:hypothetical protein